MQTQLDFSMDRVALIEELCVRFILTEQGGENLASFLMEEDDIDTDVFEVVYSHYMDSGEMPYGVAKARDGDPYEWIFNQLSRELDL